MACDLKTLLKTPQVWNSLDDYTIICIQIALMCDALDGVPVSGQIDVKALQSRITCFNKFGKNTILGIWTTLFSQILNVAATGASQILSYTTDPNTEGLVPPNPNAPSVCYPANTPGGGTMFQWVIADQQWE